MIAASKSRKRAGDAREKDLADAMDELERTSQKLQHSEETGRESRRVAKGARKQMAATNKTLKDMSAQE